jgi:Zn finger protein HypA/HybF involved in hydrogenase expression
LPLQLGKSALVEAAITSTMCLTAVTVGLVVLPGAGTLGWIVGVLLALAGAVAAWWGVTGALGSRASDVVLGPDGLRIEGGPRRGLALRWEELVVERCRTENDRVPDGADKKVRGIQLLAATRDGRDVLLAEVWQAEDRPALRLLVDEIRAVYGLPAEVVEADAPAPPPSADQPAQLCCEACGASVPPVDADRTSCPHCAATVTVGAAIRTRLRGSAKIQAERVRARGQIAALLDQPGATRANLAIGLCAIAALAMPLVATLAYATLRAHHAAGAGVAIVAWLGAIALALAVTCLGWLPVTRRAALRACLLDLGARPGDDVGTSYRCRTCGGGLPAATEPHEIAIRCIYCGSDNLLGVDPRPWNEHAQRQRGSIEEILLARRASLGSARWTFVVLAVIGLAAWAWPIAKWVSVGA